MCRSPYSPRPVSLEQLPIAGEEKCPGSFQVSIKVGAALGTLKSGSQRTEAKQGRHCFLNTTVPPNSHFCAGFSGLFGRGGKVGVERED